MRRPPTSAEQKPWHPLRAHRFAGAKFVRQHVVGPYILDSDARREKLAIEVDGDTHAAQNGYDAARTAFLEDMGYRVIRFSNADVMGNIEGVASVIAAALAPLPTLSPEGRGLDD